VDRPRPKDELATGKTGVAGNRPIHANVDDDPRTVWASEIRFLEYRLEVIRSWPDSARKRVALEGVIVRLRRSREIGLSALNGNRLSKRFKVV